MAGYAAAALVQQHVLDALGRWAERATGVRAYHGEQNATKPERPYVAIEWLEEPGPSSPRVEREMIEVPTGATITLDAAEGEWSGVQVNLAVPGLQRGAPEEMTDFADRFAALLAPFLAGRVEVTRDGEADIIVAAVTIGDLWLVKGIEHATVVPTAAQAARIAERVYTGTCRVWVIGAARTSGKAGDAGAGAGVMELVSLLVEALVEPWCRELFDQFGLRCGTPEPRPVTSSGRRSNALRETRAYIDIEISATARFGLAPAVATGVGFAIGLQPTDPEIEAVLVEIDLEP